MSAKAPAKGTTAKHATTSKASASSTASKKHAPTAAKKPATAQAKGAKVTTAAKPAKPAKPAGFAIGDLLPVCAFEAVAMSARLAGYNLSDDDVAGAWSLLGCPEEGVRIGEALGIAARQGIGGVRPGQFDYRRLTAAEGDALATVHLGQRERRQEAVRLLIEPCGDSAAEDIHGLILRIDHPGSHAVLATPDGWWSWGALYSPWDARVEEAWGVSWG